MPRSASATRSELADRTANPTQTIAGGGGQVVHVDLIFDNVAYNPEDVFDALEAKYSGRGSLSTAQGSNKDLTFTAQRRAGQSSALIRIRYVVAGNNTPLSVAVSGNDITVNLATGAGGAATSTALEILGAINVDPAAAALVFAAVKATQNGSGVPAAMAYTALAAGTSKVTTDRDTQSGRQGAPLQFRISA